MTIFFKWSKYENKKENRAIRKVFNPDFQKMLVRYIGHLKILMDSKKNFMNNNKLKIIGVNC